MNDTNNNNVLVILATGKLGSGVVDAFVQAKYNVYGTSRDAKHPKLISKGVTPVPFAYGDKLSVKRALDISTPRVLIVITACQVAKSLETEVIHGKIILDAAKEANVPHVILTSTDMEDTCPAEAYNVRSKKELEDYIKQLGLPCYSIVRSSSFFENLDDPTIYNPLCRGYLRDLYEGWVRVNHVSTFDVGKASLAMAKDPERWHAKRLSCVVSIDTGKGLAETLAKVSGIAVVYRATPPRLILKMLMPHLYHMVDHLRKRSHDEANLLKKIEEFKYVVPDALDFEMWLLERQKTWSDGTRFGSDVPSKHAKMIVGIAIVAVCYGAMRSNYNTETWGV